MKDDFLKILIKDDLYCGNMKEGQGRKSRTSARRVWTIHHNSHYCHPFCKILKTQLKHAGSFFMVWSIELSQVYDMHIKYDILMRTAGGEAEQKFGHFK